MAGTFIIEHVRKNNALARAYRTHTSMFTYRFVAAPAVGFQTQTHTRAHITCANDVIHYLLLENPARISETANIHGGTQFNACKNSISSAH